MDHPRKRWPPKSVLQRVWTQLIRWQRSGGARQSEIHCLGCQRSHEKVTVHWLYSAANLPREVPGEAASHWALLTAVHYSHWAFKRLYTADAGEAVHCGSLHWGNCSFPEPSGKNLRNPGEKSLPPRVSLQRPLLIKLNIMPGSEGDRSKGQVFDEEAVRVNLEQRGNQLITGV